MCSKTYNIASDYCCSLLFVGNTCLSESPFASEARPLTQSIGHYLHKEPIVKCGLHVICDFLSHFCIDELN